MTATLEEALRPRVQVYAGRAQRTLATLANQPGYRVLDGSSDAPSRVRICPMDTPTTWSRLSGSGLGAIYEMEEAS